MKSSITKSIFGGYDPIVRPAVTTRDAETNTFRSDPWDKKGTRDVFGDELIGEVEKIADRYQSSVREKASDYADRVLQGDFDSDEELMDKAKASLDETYGVKKDTLSENYGEKLADLTGSKSEYVSDRTAAKAKVQGSYDKAWDENLETLARKGVSHSSIADLTKEQLQSGREGAIREVDESYDRKVQAIDRKIEKLTASYNQALRNYEITYAIKLEDKLNKLKSERDKAADKYKEEHADERESAYNAYLAKEDTRNYTYEKENGDYFGDKKANYEERVEYLVGALAGKSKEGIATFLKEKESDLKKYLGLYYDRFIEEVS